MAINRLVAEGTATIGKTYIYVFAPIPRIDEAREILGEVDGVRFLNPVYFSSFPRDASGVWVLDGSHNQEAIVTAGAKVLRPKKADSAEPRPRKRKSKAD